MIEDEDHLKAWRLFREGNADSFKKIYDYYFDRLLNYGAKFTTDVEIAEDAVQDLFAKLWNNRQTINDTGSVKNYLYKSYRRTLIAKLTAHTQVKMSSLDEHDALSFDFEISYEQIKINREDSIVLQTKMQKALCMMNARQKEILYLRFYEDLPYEQIAELMDLSQKSAYKLVYRALDKLKGILEQLILVFFVKSIEILLICGK